MGMGGAVYGLLAVIAVVLLAKRLGLRRPQGDWYLIGAVVAFLTALFFEGYVLIGADHEMALLAVLCAMGGWALLLYAVFDAVRSADAAEAE